MSQVCTVSGKTVTVQRCENDAPALISQVVECTNNNFVAHLQHPPWLCYNPLMRLPSSRIGWALIPGALVLGLSGLAVAGQSGLFTGALEDEAREYAFVVWGIAGALIISGIVIIILNIMKKKRSRR